MLVSVTVSCQSKCRYIFSLHRYLNLISYGQDWFKYYKCDPHDFIGKGFFSYFRIWCILYDWIKEVKNRRSWSSVEKLLCGVVSLQASSISIIWLRVMFAIFSFEEFVDSTNVIQTTWPRASVVAERLWSSADVKEPKAAIPRLEEQRCRYVRRGIPAAPINGPSSCNVVNRT